MNGISSLLEQAWEIGRHLFSSQELMAALSQPEYMIAAFVVLNLIVFTETGVFHQ